MKKGFIVVVLSVLILCFGFTIYIYTGLNIELEKDTTKCEVNEECLLPVVVSSYRGEMLETEMNNSVDNSQLGEYTVEYKASMYFVFKTRKLVVTVVDTQSPALKLNGSMMLLTNSADYTDPLYTVTDNYDDEVTVEINAEDFTDEGVYTVEYKATDSSGNISYEYRDIWYRKDFDDFNADSSVFNLRDISKAVNPREIPLEYEDLKNYWFIGDSIVRDLGYTASLPAESVLAYPALGPVEMDVNQATFMNIDTELSPFTLVSWYKPDRIVYNFGICSMEKTRMDELLQQFEVLFNGTNVYSDGAKVYMVSILPIKGNEAGTKPNNESINTMNYLLAELCEYRYIPFINVAEALKDENGYGKEEYYENDGYHLNEEGQKVYMDYIMNYLGD